MKHATAKALESVQSLLAKIRKYPTLQEKKIGIFYRRSNAFLHFHEDPLGIFAHLKTTGGWKRIPVNTAKEMRLFLNEIKKTINE